MLEPGKTRCIKQLVLRLHFNPGAVASSVPHREHKPHWVIVPGRIRSLLYLPNNNICTACYLRVRWVETCPLHLFVSVCHLHTCVLISLCVVRDFDTICWYMQKIITMYLRNNIPFLVIACILCRVSGQKCYFPNGTAARTGSQTPCNKTTGAESMCCHSENIDLPDRCRADGLCIPSDNEFLWRNGCTDPTWKDPACLNICVDGLGEVKARPTMYSTGSETE